VLKREELSTICGELISRFKNLIQTALSSSHVSVDAIVAIEILGGGLRMPILQNILLDTFKGVSNLGAKFDDSSIALGAALLAVNSSSSTTNAGII
jgi:molecular chaperone DnaK (HSP70)